MSTNEYEPRHFHPRIALGMTVLLSVLALAPLTANADRPHAPADFTRAAAVSLADLDLSTAAGLSTAHERVREVARQLCSQLERELVLAHQPNYSICVTEAVSNAQRQVATAAATQQSRRLVSREE